MPKKSRLELLHQYYSYTGFYKFVGNAVIKSLPIILVIVVALVVVNQFYNLNNALVKLTETLPTFGVIVTFFISETILGLIPPEIFIAWAGKLNNPWAFLAILATASYLGGLLAYWLGVYITKIPKVHNYLKVKMEKQLKNSKKWGGFLIMVGALFPLPFSISCLAAGLIDFPFKSVMLYGTLRFVRFLIYGLIIFNVV